MFQLDPPEDDDLYIPEVGPWSAEKHHFLRRYIDAFTTAMRNKGWAGLHYVDLFASAGIERLEGDGLDWGSALIAAQAPHRFACLHLADLDRRSFEALSQRVSRFQQPSPPQLLLGNANEIVDEVVKAIPPRALTLAFLDPYGLHLHFKTVRRLSEPNRKMDLIIFFPDHLDALRNWKIYAEKQDSNLTLFLGTSEWAEQFRELPRSKHAHALRMLYEKQLAALGYEHFEYERINRSDGRPLYLLMFCCKDKAGGKIWRNVAKRKHGGQDTFGF